MEAVPEFRDDWLKDIKILDDNISKEEQASREIWCREVQSPSRML